MRFVDGGVQILGFVFFGVFNSLAAPSAYAQIVAAAVSINPATRTVTTEAFTVTWDTGADTDAITSLKWKQGANLTSTFDLDTCGVGNDVQFFGNAWAPPDPQSGGLVLVGGGMTTPKGTKAWAAQMNAAGTIQITTNSTSTSCPSTSVDLNVQTSYRFFDSNNSRVNWFGVQRVFDFSSAVFAHDLRPYVPRLNISTGYTEILYPGTGNELVVFDATNCASGCTGPVIGPGAAPLSPAWDSTQGWFAIHNPSTQQGVVIKRRPTFDPQGRALVPQLWIDYDGPSGSYETNASSFLILDPPGGFSDGLVTEVETMCFYDSTIWTPSLLLPTGCVDAPFNLSPWALTFGGSAIGVGSSTKTATLTNYGAGAVAIEGIVASGDFTQTNNCPKTIAAGASCAISVTFTPSATGIRSGTVSILDLLDSSPQILSLAGLGVAAR